MANERKTEKIVRNILTRAGYTDEEFNIEEQQSDNPKIKELLSKASKSGTGNTGYPEFIITKKTKTEDNDDLIIVIECKADIDKHCSEDCEDPVNYAVDGALHYAEHLYSEYNVVCIGISGETEKELLMTAYLLEKGSEEFKEIEMPEGKILKYDDLQQCLSSNIESRAITEEQLMKYAKKLHNDLRDYANLPEQDKPLLVSGILLALQKKSFRISYEEYEDNELADELYKAVRKQLEKASIPLYKENNLISVFSFITSRIEFKKIHKKLKENPLKYFIRGIHKQIYPFIKDNHAIDIIGKFYGEFLRYSGGDGKGLGIVLTPMHICELMVELTGVNENSIVLDTCTGTAGFLIAAMLKMIELANGDEYKIMEIKRNQLIGIELQDRMFSLACANMILRGDGKANMHHGSCFDVTEELLELEGERPNIGLMNPPYSQKGDGLSELDFIENLLDTLEPGGKAAVIVPMSVAIDCSKGKLAIRKRILKNHTLDAVMKMPLELFKGSANTQTIIMTFTAGIKHNKRKQTWFADWSDDGFIWSRSQGRIPGENWENIREQWLIEYENRAQILGHSLSRHIEAEDEWIYEAYVDTDYNNLSIDHFEKTLFNYKLFNKEEDIKDLYLLIKKGFFDKNDSFSNEKTPELNIAEWKSFKLIDLFDLENGKGYLSGQALGDPGENPFVCSSESNNGISGYTSLTNTHDGNCLTINKDGSVGCAFYQEKAFSTNKHVIVATPKFEEFNKYIAMFLIPIIELEKFRYSFARAWGLDRMKTTIIKLPVNESGEPDYEFMENYIKTLPYSKYI